MPVEVNIYDDTYQAFGDLRSNQFYFVEVQAAGKVQICSADTAVGFGILQNNPNSGQKAVVRHIGKSKLVFISSVAAGNLLSAAANGAGKLVVPGTDTGDYIAAMAVEAAVSGDIKSAIICSMPMRAA